MKKSEVTTRELELIFNVTNMTVVNWRKGSTRLAALPFHEIEGNVRSKIYFKWSEVKDWAKTHGIEIVVPKDQVLALRKTRK